MREFHINQFPKEIRILLKDNQRFVQESMKQK